MQVVRVRILEVAVALGDQQHAAVARQGLVHGLHRAVAGQEERQRHVGEDHELAQRDDGQLVGKLDRVVGIGHAPVSSRACAGLRRKVRGAAPSPSGHARAAAVPPAAYSERSSARWTGRRSPSCATDATSTPSRVKMLPRAKPRAPTAAGLSCT